MTDTWRLSGGIGDVPSVNGLEPQKMTQGLGFPLRPVANVPPEGAEGAFNTETVASGNFMQFMPNGWEEGKYHMAGSVVTNGLFTMVANVANLGNPYPKPADAPTFTIPTFTPSTQSDESVIFSGHIWTFTEDVLVKTLRIWVTQLTVDTNYRVVVVKSVLGSDPITTVLEEPVLAVGEWTNVALLNELIIAGTTILIYLDALNSGSDNVVSGGWVYNGQDNISPPLAQGWNQNNARTLLRIDKTDLDSTDRTAELLGITANSTVQFADTNNPSAFDLYRTTGVPVDAGTYIQYPVVLNEQGEGGVPIGTTSMTATVPIAQPTEYAQELAGLADPAWATVTPFLEFNGVDQTPAADTAFGVDLEADITTFNPDWSVMSLNA